VILNFIFNLIVFKINQLGVFIKPLLKKRLDI